MSHIPCSPTFRPSAGDEDYTTRSSTAKKSFYIVGLGFVPGIYTDSRVARKQVHKFSNGQWQKASTYRDAVTIWNAMCLEYHDHSGNLHSPPSPSPSLSPSPSPRAVPPPPVRPVHLASSRDPTSTSHRTPIRSAREWFPWRAITSFTSHSHSLRARGALFPYGI
ncbi:hypothetical protein K438DRAFT_1994617 [Mycena galopus ATCC 62051]|nr:hypothetical protein K438DRAFT_1994617 [Mycena galopus ATCC 62051]